MTEKVNIDEEQGHREHVDGEVSTRDIEDDPANDGEEGSE